MGSIPGSGRSPGGGPRRLPAQPGRPGALRSLPMPAGLARLRAPGPHTRLGTCDAPWLTARASANSHGVSLY